MDLNLSSDSHHIDSPFSLQGNHRADGSAHKASRCFNSELIQTQEEKERSSKDGPQSSSSSCQEEAPCLPGRD